MRTVELMMNDGSKASVTIAEPLPQVIVREDVFYVQVDDGRQHYVPLYSETTGLWLLE